MAGKDEIEVITKRLQSDKAPVMTEALLLDSILSLLRFNISDRIAWLV